MTTVILGASAKPERFSHQAQQLLMEHGHEVIPISPSGAIICGVSVLNSIPEIDLKQTTVDTVTLYLNPQRLLPLLLDILELAPRRVIFNPGTESPQARDTLQEAGIETVEDCTLVMLLSGNY